MQPWIISFFMKKQRLKPMNRTDIQSQNKMHLSPKGTVLVYVVVLMLIFGILGVVMVSLFTSSIASSTDRNDFRRARYMAESGTRYAFSELRKNDFDLNFMIDPLNTTTYTVTDGGSFTINVFSSWFESSESLGNQSIDPGPGPLVVDVPIGELPDGYTTPASGVYAINYKFTGNTLANDANFDSWAQVTNFDETTPAMTLNDDFNAGSGERVCLAVLPKAPKVIDQPGRDMILWPDAKTIFPEYGGAISIFKDGTIQDGLHEYFYEQRIDDPANNRVWLRNLTAARGTNYDITVATSDFVILSPRNYMVTPTGQSDGTTYGGDFTFARGIYDSSLIHRQRDLGWSSGSEQETDTRFFEFDAIEDKLYIGGGRGGGGGLTDEFGSAFFDADVSIGGDQDYCQQGACLFALGVRVYFLLEFIDGNQGDGITFTLLSGPPNNTAGSAGGDVDLSELMGYAGDSRTNSAGTTFLATAESDQGLEPPKIAVEFDTRANNDTLAYCNGASLNENTRYDDDPVNDPDSIDQDAVQYVFWGREMLDLDCRSDADNSTYDDNRHDADGDNATEEWSSGTTGAVGSSPAVGPDGVVYVVSDGKLYAINPDGSPKWDRDNNLGHSPAYDDNGTPADISDDTIYAAGSGNGFLYAFKPNGDPKGLSWPFDTQGDLDSSPTVGPDHTIYIGRDHEGAADPGKVIAVNPDGTPRGLNWPFEVPTPVENDIDAQPVVDDNGTPADTTDDTIYASSEDGFTYAINPDGTPKGLSWPFNTGYVTTAAAIGADGTVYVGSHNDNVYAINPDGNPKGLSWPFTAPSGNIRTSPAIDPNDGTIYIGSDDGHLYAINPNGTEKWRFPDPGSIGAVQSSPLIDFDGTIYFGSNDNNVYAVNRDGTERWQFPTGGPVKSSPTIGEAGFIHVGSDDTNVYTISQFADPRNFRDKLLTSADLGLSVPPDSTIDWLNGASTEGPWAVRLEVDRDILGNYELRLWMKQCNNDACIMLNGIDDPFFKDTRIIYQLSPPNMVQLFQLDAIKNAEFDRFLFGFTGAAGADPLNVAIANFTLSFIRPGDPVIN